MGGVGSVSAPEREMPALTADEAKSLVLMRPDHVTRDRWHRLRSQAVGKLLPLVGDGVRALADEYSDAAVLKAQQEYLAELERDPDAAWDTQAFVPAPVIASLDPAYTVERVEPEATDERGARLRAALAGARIGLVPYHEEDRRFVEAALGMERQIREWGEANMLGQTVVVEPELKQTGPEYLCCESCERTWPMDRDRFMAPCERCGGNVVIFMPVEEVTLRRPDDFEEQAGKVVPASIRVLHPDDECGTCGHPRARHREDGAWCDVGRRRGAVGESRPCVCARFTSGTAGA